MATVANKAAVPYRFSPRPYQDAFYDAIPNGFNRGVAVWHRRGGKDKTAWNVMVREAFKVPGVYYYFFPSFTQGRKVLWDGIDPRTNMKFIDHIPPDAIEAINNTEMKITLKAPKGYDHGSIIQIVGTDNYNAIMGTNPKGCVFSEYALQDPRAWDYIRPILLENDGWAFFIYTPRGHNHGKRMSDKAMANPDWFHEILTVRDTVKAPGVPVISQDQIEAERQAGMDDDLIDQEFGCSFEASVPGAYWGKQLRIAREQGRICKVPVDHTLPVHTFWDLGMDDQTTIWFIQFAVREIWAVGYYSNNNEDPVHYVNFIRDWRDARNCTLGMTVLPHDGNTRARQTKKTYKHILKVDYHMGDVRCMHVPATKMAPINAVRMMFPRLWIDVDECEDGIDCLSNYRKELKEKESGDLSHQRKFGDHPVHDWSSHGAEALGVLGLFTQVTPQATPDDDFNRKLYGKGQGGEGAWMGG